MTKPGFDLEALQRQVGETTSPGPWLRIDQAMIDQFADVTFDDQWIHTDPARARAESPFGGPIAHGLLVFSLIPKLIQGQAPWTQMGGTGINYGAERVRYIAPVPAGARVRARQTLLSVESYEEGVKLLTRVEVELEGSDKPACVAELILIILP